MSTALLESRFLPLAQVVRQCMLPVPGRVLVSLGDQVHPQDCVAEAWLDGELVALDLVGMLGISAKVALRSLCVREGQAVKSGDVLARVRAFLRPSRRVLAPSSGTIQGVSEGRLLLRAEPRAVRLRAMLAGEVVEHYPGRGVVIRAMGSVVRGAWGSGGVRSGLIRTSTSEAHEALGWEHIGVSSRGAIVFGGVVSDKRVLMRSQRLGVAGLVVGSIAPELRELCKHVTLPILVTEGFGRIPMAEPIYRALEALQGRTAVLDGGADGDSGARLLVPLPGSAPSRAVALVRSVTPGSMVRLTRPPYTGVLGQVLAIPSLPQATHAGGLAEGAEVRLRDGRRLFVPYVNMELLA